MSKHDLSIEFAHIYADRYFAEEQQYSLQLAKEKKHHALLSGKSVTTLVMIDDLHASRVITGASQIKDIVAQNGDSVDNIVFESSLVPAALELIDNLPNSLIWRESFCRRSKTVLFLKTLTGAVPLLTIKDGRQIPSCAALSATLLLARLGALRSVKGVVSARNVVTIIDERFRYLEQCAHSIISTTCYAQFLMRIDTILFETPEARFLNAA
jgi:hypothetical protein